MLKEAELQKIAEKYDNSLVEKLAGLFSQRVQTWLKDNPWAVGGVIAPLAASGVLVGVESFWAAMKDWFSKHNGAKEKDEYFIRMLNAHPGLTKADPAVVAQYWESLYHFAPNMAADPLAAGAYITQSLKRGYSAEFGGPPPDVFKTLTEIQRSFNDRGGNSKKDRPFMDAFSAVSGGMKIQEGIQEKKLKQMQTLVDAEKLKNLKKTNPKLYNDL